MSGEEEEEDGWAYIDAIGERRAALEAAAKRAEPLVMTIIPGESTAQDTVNLLAALTDLYHHFGGRGLKFVVTPVDAPADQATAQKSPRECWLIFRPANTTLFAYSPEEAEAKRRAWNCHPDTEIVRFREVLPEEKPDDREKKEKQ